MPAQWGGQAEVEEGGWELEQFENDEDERAEGDAEEEDAEKGGDEETLTAEEKKRVAAVLKERRERSVLSASVGSVLYEINDALFGSFSDFLNTKGVTMGGALSSGTRLRGLGYLALCVGVLGGALEYVFQG